MVRFVRALYAFASICSLCISKKDLPQDSLSYTTSRLQRDSRYHHFLLFPDGFYTGLQPSNIRCHWANKGGREVAKLETHNLINDGIVSHFDVRPQIYTSCTGIDLALPTRPRKAARASLLMLSHHVSLGRHQTTLPLPPPATG